MVSDFLLDTTKDMKKVVLCVFAILVLSCSSDDDTAIVEDQNVVHPSFDVDKLIGAWVYKSIKVNGETFPYEHNPNCQKDVFGFYNQEGKYFDYEELTHVDENCATSGISLKWKVKKDIISLYFGEQLALSYQVLSVTNTRFVVLVSEDIDNDGKEDHIEITALREDPYGWFPNE